MGVGVGVGVGASTLMVVREDFLEEREAMLCPEESPGRTVCSEHVASFSGAELRPMSCLPGKREGKEVHPRFPGTQVKGPIPLATY